jgi:hypothetical protein
LALRAGIVFSFTPPQADQESRVDLRRANHRGRAAWIDDQALLNGTGASSAAVLGFGLPAEAFAQATTPTNPQWDAGRLRHLLPQVSDSQMLIKASFSTPMLDAPTLRVGDLSVRGRMSDTHGEHWHFHAGGLRAERRYTLSLATADGRAPAAPWELATFPTPTSGRRFRACSSSPAPAATRRCRSVQQIPADGRAQSPVATRAELCAAGCGGER